MDGAGDSKFYLHRVGVGFSHSFPIHCRSALDNGRKLPKLRGFSHIQRLRFFFLLFYNLNSGFKITFVPKRNAAKAT